MSINILNNLADFLKKRTFELVGLVLIFLSIALTISFITYSPNDPSFIYGEENHIIKNFFGIYGSIVSDFLLQSFGLIAFLLLATFISWGFKLILKKQLEKIILKMFFIVLYFHLFSAPLKYFYLIILIKSEDRLFFSCLTSAITNCSTPPCLIVF